MYYSQTRLMGSLGLVWEIYVGKQNSRNEFATWKKGTRLEDEPSHVCKVVPIAQPVPNIRVGLY